jgi:hypothetical protein
VKGNGVKISEADQRLVDNAKESLLEHFDSVRLLQTGHFASEANSHSSATEAAGTINNQIITRNC